VRKELITKREAIDAELAKMLGGSGKKLRARPKNAVFAIQKAIRRGLALKAIPMGQVIPFRKPALNTTEVEASLAKLLELLNELPKRPHKQ